MKSLYHEQVNKKLWQLVPFFPLAMSPLTFRGPCAHASLTGYTVISLLSPLRFFVKWQINHIRPTCFIITKSKVKGRGFSQISTSIDVIIDYINIYVYISQEFTRMLCDSWNMISSHKVAAVQLNTSWKRLAGVDLLQRCFLLVQ